MRRWRPFSWPKVAALLPSLFAAIAGTAVVLAAGTTENAVANGDTRTIHLHHAHTQESIDATFMVNGQYDPAVLQQLNWFLRDWRHEEATKMDPRLFDTIWEVYRESGSQQPIQVMSAYRSPETNAMLRRRSRAVAEHSQHILGKAMDQHYVDVPVSRIREIAMRLQRGGVGFYPTAGSPFVHMDVGGVRHWPRMSYDQLARLFPDGKTVHIPSNGQPLSGYEEARAELESRGDSFNYPTAGEVKSKGFFAWLFGGSGEEEGDGEAARGDAGGGRAAPQANGRRVVASIDRNAVGSVAIEPPRGNADDSGQRSFFALNNAPPQDRTPAAAAPTRGRNGRVQVAALPTGPSAAEAQQRLAQEMQRQEQARAAAQAQAQAAQAQAQAAQAQAQAAQAAQAQAQADAAAQASAQADAAAQPVPSAASAAPEAIPVQPVAPLRATTLANAPLPPRRPVEFASAGPALPLPPSRPAQMAAATDHAPPPPAARPDAIASALAAVAPGARSGLPAAITQGAGPGKSQTPPRVLAYAMPIGTPPPLPSAVPLPIARPQFVAARLDRSNFRSLTGATPADRSAARVGLGSAVSALRPAAQTSLGTLSGASTSGPATGFRARASDLSTDRFSGTAVKPLERVSTANLKVRATAAD